MPPRSSDPAIQRLDSKALAHQLSQGPPVEFTDFFETSTVFHICVGLVCCHILLGAGLFSYVCAWSPFEATWFAIVTMTTVGYGDYIPNGNNLQKCCGILYIWLSISLIGFCMGVLAAKAETKELDDKNSSMETLFGAQSVAAKRFLMLGFFVGIGVVVFPNIEKGWSSLDGLYFATVTLSSVGYGALTPVTPLGRVVGMAYLLSGVVMTSSLVGGIIQGAVDDRKESQRELFMKRALTPQSIIEMDKNGDGVDELEWTVYMLEKTQLVEKAEVDKILKIFTDLDRSNDHRLTAEDIIAGTYRRQSIGSP